MSKYPPAEPGALRIGPLEAATLDSKLYLFGRRELIGWMPLQAALYDAMTVPWWCQRRRGICQRFTFRRSILRNGAFRFAQ